MYNRTAQAIDENDNQYFVHNDESLGIIYMFYNEDASGWYINIQLLPSVSSDDAALLSGWRSISSVTRVNWPIDVTSWEVYDGSAWSTDNTELISTFCVEVNSDDYDDDTIIIRLNFFEKVNLFIYINL